MARTTYNLAPCPFWPLFQANGTSNVNGYMLAWEAEDHATPKAVFRDQNGFIAWSSPIPWSGSGMGGVFYFASSSNYFLQFFDSHGSLIGNIDNYNSPIVINPPSQNSVSGNLIINGQFLYNIGTINSFSANTQVGLCAGSTERFYTYNGQTGNFGISFIKNNTSATDIITFNRFNQGTTGFEGNPSWYLSHSCTVAGTSETLKDYYFPITADVQRLQGQDIQFDFYGRSSSGSEVEVYYLQYFGPGSSASASVLTLIESVTLNNTWTKYSLNGAFTIPSTNGKVISPLDSDLNFIIIRMPLNTTCNVNMTNVASYLGQDVLPYPLLTDEQLSVYFGKPRTGDVRVKFGNDFMPGWLPMDNGSIGQVGSAATHAADNTWNLYNFLYTNISDTYAPVSGGRGASAIADFIAGKTLTLSQTLGRVLGSSGDGKVMGQFSGDDSHTMTSGELVAHVHAVGGSFSPAIYNDPAADRGAGLESTVTTEVIGSPISLTGNTGSTGSTTPFSIEQASIYGYFYIKL